MRGNVQGFTSLVVNGGETMPGLITMDDLTNDEILQILDDAERLLPVAKERFICHYYRVESLAICSLNPVLEPVCRLKLQ